MVTVPSDQPTAGPKGVPNNPPYPMSPMSEPRPTVQRARKPTLASSASAVVPPPLNPDSESDWEKDGMDDDEDWEIADTASDAPKASGQGKTKEEQTKPGLPASLRAGPPPGSVVRKKSSENMLAVSSQISLPVSSIAGSSTYGSQVSLQRPTPPPAAVPTDSIAPLTTYVPPPPATYALTGSHPAPQLPVGYPTTIGYPPQSKPATNNAQPPAAPIKKQSTGEKIFGVESSPQWQPTRPAQVTYDEPVELPVAHTPVDQFAQLNLAHSPSSFQPPLIPVDTEDPRQGIDRHESNASSNWNPGVDLSFADGMHSRGQRLPSDAIASPSKSWQEQQNWERTERERRDRDAATALNQAQQQEQLRRAEEDWHHGEVERREREQEESRTPPPATLPDGTPIPPPPPRPQPNTAPPRSAMRSAPEHYAIKHIRWFDAESGKTRISPILIQNANGPCPLLALVNALVLSTPESEVSGLVETLRTREQVSLSLVLDAVFDELTSGRRGGATQDLPDVAELYEFLKNLHTGMNVNPRFTYLPDRASRELHPAYRPTDGPGGFEETKEMALYSVFHIPLVHGWIPPRNSPPYQAFHRSAKTYEDAQNIQFHEEELEHKLTTSGLTPQEQETFEDLFTIKSFLETWPTQLTDTGLQSLLAHIKPGSFCILFRNDHFSTIFKELKANQLLTLVTDSGYATHDEIVWESLVDVSGQGSELFSGDFRPVSHNSQPGTSSGPPVGPRGSSLAGSSQNIQSMLDVGDNDDDWSTVQRGRNRASQQTPNRAVSHQPDTTTSEIARAEQEDHDLALAMQLQEEEDDRVRRETEARQRENVFEGSGRNNTGGGSGGVNIPVSGPNNHNNNSAALPPLPARNTGRTESRPTNNSIIPSRRPGRNSSSGDIPPPSYQHAASVPAYVPGIGVNTGASGPGYVGTGPQSSQQWGAPQGGMGRGGQPAPLYGSGGGGAGAGGQGNGRGKAGDREKCVVM